MCLGLIQLGKFQKIIHRFPERGHSFLLCDRVFGVLKRKISKCDRIYTPKQYVEIICNSRQNIKVGVVMVNTDIIMDLDSWGPNYYKKQFF